MQSGVGTAPKDIVPSETGDHINSSNRIFVIVVFCRVDKMNNRVKPLPRF